MSQWSKASQASAVCLLHAITMSASDAGCVSLADRYDKNFLQDPSIRVRVMLGYGYD